MDPNQTLADMETALIDRRLGRAAGCAADLAGWLVKGGFEPDWEAHPLAAQWFWTYRKLDRLRDIRARLGKLEFALDGADDEHLTAACTLLDIFIIDLEVNPDPDPEAAGEEEV